MPDHAIDDVLKRAEELIPVGVEWIKALLEGCAVSRLSPDPEQAKKDRDRVESSVDQVAEHLKKHFGTGALPATVRVHRLNEEHPDALPCITVHWRQSEELPTVLVYGHGDVQPAGEAGWQSDPFKGVLRGNRLYGRGSSDDIGGWISHLVAIRAWLETRSRLPLNIRMLIEFEEEIGSPNLTHYFDLLGDFLDVDAMILTDCANYSLTVPGLTTSLRGIAEADLCSTDGRDGVDASMALAVVLNELLHPDGRPEFALVDVPERKRRELEKTTVDGDLPERMFPRAEWAWHQPALTVTGTSLPCTSGPLDVANAIQPTVSLRLRFAAKLERCRRLLDEVARVPSVPGVVFSTREVQPTEAELTCATGRDTALHSGLYGSVSADPACLVLQRASLLLKEAERLGMADLISITATSLPRIAGSSPRLRLSVRVPPSSRANNVVDELEERVERASSSRGFDVSLEPIAAAGWIDGWSYEPPECVGMAAVYRANFAGWGSPIRLLGVGGSIGFIPPFGHRFGHRMPLILNGVLDPDSALHAANESLDLGVFARVIHTTVHLLSEFGRLSKGTFLSKGTIQGNT